MTNEGKQLLLKDLCARLPYGVKCDWNGKAYELVEIDIKRGLAYIFRYDWIEPMSLPYSIPRGDEIKPYLRPMSSMTEKEAKTLVTLWGIEDFISLDIAEEYIGVVCDDGFSSTATTELWYNGDMSIECFDFLNSRHLDYRGLIPVGLALPALEGMYNFK